MEDMLFRFLTGHTFSDKNNRSSANLNVVIVSNDLSLKFAINTKWRASKGCRTANKLFLAINSVIKRASCSNWIILHQSYVRKDTTRWKNVDGNDINLVGSSFGKRTNPAYVWGHHIVGQNSQFFIIGFTGFKKFYGNFPPYCLSNH